MATRKVFTAPANTNQLSVKAKRTANTAENASSSTEDIRNSGREYSIGPRTAFDPVMARNKSRCRRFLRDFLDIELVVAHQMNTGFLDLISMADRVRCADDGADGFASIEHS